MDLVRLKYNGRKAFKDKASKTSWDPGDSKLVTVDGVGELDTVFQRILAALPA